MLDIKHWQTRKRRIQKGRVKRKKKDRETEGRATSKEERTPSQKMIADLQVTETATTNALSSISVRRLPHSLPSATTQMDVRRKV